MRKLIRPQEPQELEANKDILTKEYTEKPTSSVWRKDYIVEPLYESSSRKCAYCGNQLIWKKGDHSYFVELNEEAQYKVKMLSENENNFLHIDHFIAKKYDMSKVVEWSNLVPSCPTCNYKKGAHNVIQFPIINPFEDDPKEYFRFSNCTIIVRCTINDDLQSKASRTITLFSFIDRINPIISSLNLGVQQSLEKLRKDIKTGIEKRSEGDYSLFNDSHQSLVRLLEHGLPSSKYGAFMASIILKHDYYSFIKECLKSNGLWGDSLIDLENQLKEICYE
jgi:uncharacterized protein (TIGR02646 family)